jgi:phenylacetate-CoA ligase
MIWNKDVETMPRAALRDLQVERLRWSVQWAYDRVPFPLRRLAAAGVAAERIRSLDDLRRLPFMVKSDLR